MSKPKWYVLKSKHNLRDIHSVEIMTFNRELSNFATRASTKWFFPSDTQTLCFCTFSAEKRGKKPNNQRTEKGRDHISLQAFFYFFKRREKIYIRAKDGPRLDCGAFIPPAAQFQANGSKLKTPFCHMPSIKKCYPILLACCILLR